MFTFDGEKRTVTIGSGLSSFSVSDIYSRWKEWVQLSDNAKFLPAFSNSVGGNPLGGGTELGAYYFIQNGWQIKPDERDHTLTVSGNLFPIPETATVFATTNNPFNVQILQQVSSLTQRVSTTGSELTASEVADAVWDEDITGHTDADSAANELRRARINAQNAFAVSV